MNEKRAAIYLRISKQDQSKWSIDDQRDRCIEYVNSKGWEVVAEYADNGVSGRTMNRPGANQLLEDAAVGKFDAVVTMDMTRFGRGGAETLMAIMTLEELGVDFEMVENEIDTTTPDGEFFAGMLALAARYHNRLQGLKIKRGMAKKRASGAAHIANKPVYGYTKDGDELIVVETEALVIRRIFQVRATGATLRSIAEGLYVGEIPAPGGKDTWHPTSVKRVLEDKRYSGSVAGWPAILEDPDAK